MSTVEHWYIKNGSGKWLARWKLYKPFSEWNLTVLELQHEYAITWFTRQLLAQKLPFVKVLNASSLTALMLSKGFLKIRFRREDFFCWLWTVFFGKEISILLKLELCSCLYDFPHLTWRGRFLAVLMNTVHSTETYFCPFLESCFEVQETCFTHYQNIYYKLSALHVQSVLSFERSLRFFHD